MATNDPRHDILMLKHVVTALWANTIDRASGDSVAACRNIAEASLASIETIYSGHGEVGASDALHEVIQGVLRSEEQFWSGVEEMVRTAKPASR